MNIIDISRPVATGIAVWPGDQEYEPGWSARMAEGSSVNVGAVRLSLHTGTHADAPLHFEEKGAAIDELALGAYFGPALVIDARHVERLTARLVEQLPVEASPRILFKTKASEVPESQWNPDFPPFDPDLIDYLAGRNALLVGTDAASVDPADSTDLEAHHRLARHGIVNLENLSLSSVAPGRYVLAAFPLRLAGMDASPVRAVLIDGFSF